MADNNFIPLNPPESGNQAHGRGKNTGRGGRGKNRGGGAGRGNDGNRHGGVRRVYKKGDGGYADLANAMVDEKAQINGALDALREQMAQVREMKLEALAASEERQRRFKYNRLLKGLKRLNVEIKDRQNYIQGGFWEQNTWLQWIWWMIAAGFSDYYGYFDLYDCAIIVCLIQALFILVGEQCVISYEFNSIISERWWKATLCILVGLATAVFYFDYQVAIRESWFIRSTSNSYYEFAPSLLHTPDHSFWHAQTHHFLLYFVPVIFVGYTWIMCYFDDFTYEILSFIKLTCFGWFVQWEVVKVEQWCDPVAYFNDDQIGVDLRPQTQRHIKLTDAELKFGLTYKIVERHCLKFVHRSGPGARENDYFIENCVVGEPKQLIGSFGLLCELADYDVCGLESDSKIAKERILNRIRTIRSVNIDKYSAQTSNIYQHTALIALALWHHRRQELEGLPNFD